MTDETDNAGVIAPPPLIWLAVLATGIVLDRVWPLSFVKGALRYALGAVLILVSLGLATAAVLRFRRAGTHPEPWKPTTAIVTDGVYRYSRNPMYLSFTLLLAGVGVVTNNPWLIVLVVPWHFVKRYGVIGREERYLERKFGPEYLRYKDRVRRWI
jgi:protein-S-isoprenylcysteine O-methyltransferase Ste14